MRFWSKISRMLLCKFFELIILRLKNVYSIIYYSVIWQYKGREAFLRLQRKDWQSFPRRYRDKGPSISVIMVL